MLSLIRFGDEIYTTINLKYVCCDNFLKSMCGTIDMESRIQDSRGFPYMEQTGKDAMVYKLTVIPVQDCTFL